MKPFNKVLFIYGDTEYFTFPDFHESFKATKQIQKISMTVRKAAGAEFFETADITVGFGNKTMSPVQTVFSAINRDLRRTRYWWA